VILPSEASPPRWSSDHLRLHRHLLRHPDLLPQEAPLLLAVSGGQDSMALTVMLADLCRLHHWRLTLWHGDHRWRADSTDQALELQAWAHNQDLPFLLERAVKPPDGEAAARHWRYGCLERQAAALGCRHVVTGHTATDRAETFLLNLARGSHQRGLASLRALRPLQPTPAPAPDADSGNDTLLLVRPLLPFSRQDTGRICRELAVPVWEDSTNGENLFHRNRIRAEVLPVLENLHPGAIRRIAALAQRLEEEQNEQDELVDLVIRSLGMPAGDLVLRRDVLARLGRSNRRRLLAHWLTSHGVRAPAARVLEDLADRLDSSRGPGQQDLALGWKLRWDRSTLVLHSDASPDRVHGGIEPGNG